MCSRPVAAYPLAAPQAVCEIHSFAHTLALLSLPSLVDLVCSFLGNAPPSPWFQRPRAHDGLRSLNNFEHAHMGRWRVGHTERVNPWRCFLLSVCLFVLLQMLLLLLHHRRGGVWSQVNALNSASLGNGVIWEMPKPRAHTSRKPPHRVVPFTHTRAPRPRARANSGPQSCCGCMPVAVCHRDEENQTTPRHTVARRGQCVSAWPSKVEFVACVATPSAPCQRRGTGRAPLSCRSDTTRPLDGPKLCAAPEDVDVATHTRCLCTMAARGRYAADQQQCLQKSFQLTVSHQVVCGENRPNGASSAQDPVSVCTAQRSVKNFPQTVSSRSLNPPASQARPRT